MDGQIFNPILLMLYHRYVNVAQVPLCKSNGKKLENLNNKLNNTHLDSFYAILNGHYEN